MDDVSDDDEEDAVEEEDADDDADEEDAPPTADAAKVTSEIESCTVLFCITRLENRPLCSEPEELALLTCDKRPLSNDELLNRASESELDLSIANPFS